VGSSLASRLWRTSKESGRSFPRLTDDDVVDFIVTEAVGLKVAKEDAEFRKKQEKKDWQERERLRLLESQGR
jgi:hypothetical protein